jgi:hypothetical protein
VSTLRCNLNIPDSNICEFLSLSEFDTSTLDLSDPLAKDQRVIRFPESDEHTAEFFTGTAVSVIASREVDRSNSSNFDT